MQQQGRTAIVTGAGKRVGEAIARFLLAEGWTVVAHVRREDDAVPDGAVRVAADLADPDCAAAIFAATAGLPPARLLINSAARFAQDGFGEVDVREFDAHMAVNVRAPVLLMDAFAAVQNGGEDSLVINILDAKLAAPNPDYLSYTLSKQALAGASELAARAFAARRVRVNAIAPSLLLQSPGQDEDNFRSMHAANPLRRGVTPEDVIEAVRFLIASPAITGAVLTIDGGQRFWSLERDVQFLEMK